MARLRNSRLASLGAFLFAFLMGSASAQERFTRQVSFDIAAQSVEAALLEFSKQADVQVMVGTTAISGQKTEGVKGKLAVKDALRELLKNTGLDYRTEGNGTVTIRSVAAAKSDARVLPLVDGSALASNGAAGEGASRERWTVDESPAPTMETLDEIVVTGTHIRGQAAPIGAQLITFDRADIELTGLSTVQDVIRTLPQSFGGGPSEDTENGSEAITNTAKSTSINLRGLGAGATLVLINGRRLAPSGGEGSYTDLSSIPLTAIEQIDILPNGASAVYGSDAIGGVVNIKLRRDFEGAETFARAGGVTSGGAKEAQFGQALGTSWGSGSGSIAYEYRHRDPLPMSARSQTRSSDLTPLGGSNFSSPFSNPGTIQVGFDTWAIPAGQDGTSLSASDLIAGTQNLGNKNQVRDLVSEETRHSAYVAARQGFGDRVSILADSLITHREVAARNDASIGFLTVPSSNPYYVNPAGGTEPITVLYSFLDDLGPRRLDVDIDTSNTALAADVKLGQAWQLSLMGSYAREKVDQVQGNIDAAALDLALADGNPATAFNPFGDGSSTNAATLEAIRATSGFNSTSELSTVALSAEGPLFALRDEDVRMVLGVEVRRPRFASEVVQTIGETAPLRAAYKREVSAAFMELAAPLVGASSGRPGLEALTLSLAARHEDYDDFGSATTPKVGLDWSPVEGWRLKGTWSKSFKAPNVADLSELNNFSLFFPTIDSEGALANVLLWSGKNADLREERATSHTLGIFFEEAESRAAFGLTYFDISFEDRIQEIPFTGTWLAESRFANIVSQSPSLEERQRVCTSGSFLSGSLDDCLNAPIDAIVDLRLRNTAISDVSGFDFLAKYSLPLRGGNVAATLNASYLLDFSQALTTLDPALDLRNTATNPVDLRVRGSLSYSRRGFIGTVFINYLDNYEDTLSIPNRAITSWSTADIQFAYSTSGSEGIVGGVSIALNVQNVFDEDPPFFNNPNGVGYDQENADLLGRFISLQMRKRW